MNTNPILADARLNAVRNLKTRLETASRALAETRAELESLRAHFALALAAVRDFESLPPDGRLLVIDGWNVILRLHNVRKISPERLASMRQNLLSRLPSLPFSFVWVVFDGPVASAQLLNRSPAPAAPSIRVSYTGGTGPHRADRMIADYLRALKLLGHDTSRISVETADRTLAETVSSLGANIATAIT